MLILTGLNGDAQQLYSLVSQDFSGPGSFVYWLFAIIILGALGYIRGLETLSKFFLVLVIIVLFLDNGGFFAQFQAYLKSTQTPATTAGASTSAPANQASTTTAG